uniref:Myb/SANT-like DNA-binding domain-containing protein n=1 Tax=Oryzias latipes TaxID=8090 RepID=A0A3P9KZ70_ORYLA
MANTERKSKKRNFTQCEVEVIVGEPRERQTVADAVNAVASQPRTVAEIKKKWSDIKVEAKKRLALHRGGGVLFCNAKKADAVNAACSLTSSDRGRNKKEMKEMVGHQSRGEKTSSAASPECVCHGWGTGDTGAEAKPQKTSGGRPKTRISHQHNETPLQALRRRDQKRKTEKHPEQQEHGGPGLNFLERENKIDKTPLSYIQRLKNNDAQNECEGLHSGQRGLHQ